MILIHLNAGAQKITKCSAEVEGRELQRSVRAVAPYWRRDFLLALISARNINRTIFHGLAG